MIHDKNSKGNSGNRVFAVPGNPDISMSCSPLDDLMISGGSQGQKLHRASTNRFEPLDSGIIIS